MWFGITGNITDHDRGNITAVTLPAVLYIISRACAIARARVANGVKYTQVKAEAASKVDGAKPPAGPVGRSIGDRRAISLPCEYICLQLYVFTNRLSQATRRQRTGLFGSALHAR